MKTKLSIITKDQKNYNFQISFINDAMINVSLPIQNIKNNAEQIGLVIENNGTVLEALAFNIINAIESLETVNLALGESYTLDLFAEYKKLGATSWGLVFKNATYKIDPFMKYKIQFSLKQFKSNVIEWSFNTN